MMTDIRQADFLLLDEELRAEREAPSFEFAAQAFSFLQAVERASFAERPNMDFITAFLPYMTEGEAMMITSPGLQEVADIAPLTAGPMDGAIMLFADYSILWFAEDGRLGDYETATETLRRPVWPQVARAEQAVSLIAASKAFTDAHGDAEAWQALLPEDTEDDDTLDEWWSELECRLEDCYDPPIGSSIDLPDECGFEDEDTDALQTTVNLLFHAAGVTQSHSIWLACASQGSKAAFMEETLAPKELLALLPHLHDLSVFTGTEWEASDEGPADRLSGYIPSPTTIFLDFDPEDVGLSNHEKIAAHDILLSILARRGASAEIIEAFQRICPRPARRP